MAVIIFSWNVRGDDGRKEEPMNENEAVEFL